MLLHYGKQNLIWGIVLIVLISACSSTSQSQRYNRPKEKEHAVRDNSVRFTSKDENPKQLVSSNKPETAASEFDSPPVEEYPIDTKEIVKKYKYIKSISAALTDREKILFEIINYLDTPYQYGGNSKNGIDCSAFTQQVYENSVGYDLPRTAKQQFNFGNEIDDENNLKFGDLIFFNTSKRSYPGHVGIYLGEDLFAHASRSLGVTVSSLKSSYYKKRFVGARRIK